MRLLRLALWRGVVPAGGSGQSSRVLASRFPTSTYILPRPLHAGTQPLTYSTSSTTDTAATTSSRATSQHSETRSTTACDSASPKTSLPLAQLEGRMIIGFTCKVCSHRSYKPMSKHAYTKGVVLIRCDGCKNIHLIADHLGWYDSMNPPGTIEEILAKKGETVKRLTLDGGKIVDGEGQQAGEVDEGLLEFLPTMMQKGKTTPPGVAVEEETAIQKETVVVVDAQSKS